MRRASGGFLAIGIALTAVSVASGQTEAQLNRRIDLVLEKKLGKTSQVMDPTHVFGEGDLIRFRLRSGINGFLYVMNHGSSGNYVQLFPRTGETGERAVKPGREYFIPDSDTGWFRIQGPSGYETVYFLVSPMDLGASLPKEQPSVLGRHEMGEPGALAEQATPRCDDALFRTRGECLDSRAGLKPLQHGEALPDQFARVPAATSRDLVVVKDSKDTAISSTEPFDAPVIYHFRIAHK